MHRVHQLHSLQLRPATSSREVVVVSCRPPVMVPGEVVGLPRLYCAEVSGSKCVLTLLNWRNSPWDSGSLLRLATDVRYWLRLAGSKNAVPKPKISNHPLCE